MKNLIPILLLLSACTLDSSGIRASDAVLSSDEIIIVYPEPLERQDGGISVGNVRD